HVGFLPISPSAGKFQVVRIVRAPPHFDGRPDIIILGVLVEAETARDRAGIWDSLCVWIKDARVVQAPFNIECLLIASLANLNFGLGKRNVNKDKNRNYCAKAFYHHVSPWAFPVNRPE